MSPYLSDKERERDVMDVHVCPGNILYETLAADPGLKAGCIQTACDVDAVEVDVGDVGELGLVLSE